VSRPPVLGRYAALAPVARWLDDGDAGRGRTLLEGFEHRLDSFSDDYGFPFGHSITSLRRSRKTTSRQTPSSCPIRSRTPTSRKPERLSSARLASFSEKTPVSSVQIPVASVPATSRSSKAVPTPRPRAASAT